MTKGRIAKYVANTALLAVLAAAGIGVYQLGTSGKDESVPENWTVIFRQIIRQRKE